LDALLLQKGIDFMKLQKDCGTYLIQYDENEAGKALWIHDVGYYVGNNMLAEKYISELSNNFPATLDTPNPTQQLKANDKNKRQPKTFKDYLNHSNVGVLMDKLHELLDNHTSGIHIANVLEALERKGYLPEGARVVAIVIREFNIRCGQQAVSKYRNNTQGDEVGRIMNLLP